jgi:putative transposase
MAHAASRLCAPRRDDQSAVAAWGASAPRQVYAAQRGAPGLRCTTRRTLKAPTAAGQAQPVAPHHLDQACTGHGPATVYVGEMTSLRTGEGWRSLAVVLALCSRAVVGGSRANHRRAELVQQAFARASGPRHPAAGLMMPTERGSQEGAASARQLLRQHGSALSLSRKGTCGDNAVAARFFHTFKTAWLSLEDYDTHEAAQPAVFADIEVFYNRQRGHSATGYLAPLLYEQALKTSEILCPEKC